MQGIEVTDRQNKIWNEVGDSLSASLQIKHLALKYYLQYKQSLMNSKVTIDETDKINNIMRIAYFVSEKNQPTFNMQGQKIIGVALSINEIIKKNNDFQEFFLHLKEMLKVITIEDKEVEHQIETSLKKFKFTMTFHHKFVSTFAKIKPSHPAEGIARSLLWLIFILNKHSLHATTDDIIEATCMMATSFIYYLKQALRYYHQRNQKEKMYLEDNSYGGTLNSDNQIKHVILEYFRIKDMDTYQKIQKHFYDVIGSLKHKIGCETVFFQYNERNMDIVYEKTNQIYKKIDQIYQKRLTDQNIDERHFLKERINTVLFANRFTPFGGRRPVGKNRNPQPSTQIFSHRILNYEEENTETTKPSQQKKLITPRQNRQKYGENLLKNLVQNRTPTRSTPLIKATPTTNAMQMYNWVLQKSRYYKYNEKQMPVSMILKGSRSMGDNTEDILKLMYGLWKHICDSEGQKDLHSKTSYSYLIISVEIVYFVKSFNPNSLENIIKNFKLSWLDIWQRMDTVLRYDHAMPRCIKQHLLAIETNIVSRELWTMQKPPTQIFYTHQSQKQYSEINERLYNRVIHELVYQIYFLSKRLSIEQPETNLIFMIAQFAIGDCPDILVNRNLYHIVICSFYAISKVLDYNLSFCSILAPFKEINGLSKQLYNELFDDIPLTTDPKREEVGDIVKFYNYVYIRITKELLAMIKYQEGPIQITGGKIMNSSVKDLLPKKMVVKAERKIKTSNNTPQTPLETPMTQALLAYNQSPLLKQKRIKNLMSCVDGKRLLSKNSTGDKTQQTLDNTTKSINQRFKSPQLRFSNTIKKSGLNQQK